MLGEGDRAPDFDLADDAGGRVRLSALHGRTVVVYFYPKDDTEGCTREAKEFSDATAEFTREGAAVIGISPDSPKSHARFRCKHGLAVTLASDTDRAAAEAYGVWVEKSMYGRTFMGVERTTFLIGPDGRIARIWRKVRPKGHAADVLAALRGGGGTPAGRKRG